MYGLPQARIIAHDRSQKNLKNHRYQLVNFTPGLWTHKSRPISFTLIGDDYGIKYVGKKHADHQLQALQNSTKSQSIGKVSYIVHSRSSGFTKKIM